MLSVRRIGLQGLNWPLSPIMIAVMGLWPATVEDLLPSYFPTGLAKRGPPGRKWIDTYQTIQEAIDLEEVQMILASIFATEGVF